MRLSELSVMKSFYYLMGAGIPAAEVAMEMSQKINDKKMAERLYIFSELVAREGYTISQAFESIGLFLKYLQLIQVGEKTGNLSSVMRDIIETAEDIEKVKKKVKSSLYYPAGVMVVSVIVSFGLVFVLKKVLTSLDFPTVRELFMYKLGWFIVNNKYVIFLLYVAVLIGGVFFASKNLHRIPGVRDLYNRISIGQAFKIISLSLSSGLSPSEAFRNAAQASAGMWQTILESLSEEIRHRSTLEIIEEIEPYVPPDYYLILRAKIRAGDTASVFSMLGKELLASSIQKMEGMSGFVTIFAFLFVAGQIVLTMSPVWGVVISFMGTAAQGKF